MKQFFFLFLVLSSELWNFFQIGFDNLLDVIIQMLLIVWSSNRLIANLSILGRFERKTYTMRIALKMGFVRRVSEWFVLLSWCFVVVRWIHRFNLSGWTLTQYSWTKHLHQFIINFLIFLLLIWCIRKN